MVEYTFCKFKCVEIFFLNSDTYRGALAEQRAFSDQEIIEAQHQGCLSSAWHSKQTALNTLGGIYSNQSRYTEALTSYQEALKIVYEKLDDRNTEATIFGNISVIYFEQGNYEGALELRQEVLEIARVTGDQETIALSLKDIGGIYADYGQYDKAQGLLEEALRLAQEKRLSARTIA